MTRRLSSKQKVYLQLGTNFWGKAAFLWKGAKKDKWKMSPGEHKKKHRTSERYMSIGKQGTIHDMVRLGYNTSLPAPKITLSYYEPKYLSQLHEKQKLRAFYTNVTEKQLYNYYKKAGEYRGKIGDTIIQFCERRLDTLLCRAQFANSLHSARQLINHGHILVNEDVQTIASYGVKPGDCIRVKTGSISFVCSQYNWSLLKEAGSAILRRTPYLEIDYKTMTIISLYTPAIEEVQMSFDLDMNKVLRYYL